MEFDDYLTLHSQLTQERQIDNNVRNEPNTSTNTTTNDNNNNNYSTFDQSITTISQTTTPTQSTETIVSSTLPTARNDSIKEETGPNCLQQLLSPNFNYSSKPFKEIISPFALTESSSGGEASMGSSGGFMHSNLSPYPTNLRMNNTQSSSNNSSIGLTVPQHNEKSRGQCVPETNNTCQDSFRSTDYSQPNFYHMLDMDSQMSQALMTQANTTVSNDNNNNNPVYLGHTDTSAPYMANLNNQTSSNYSPQTWNSLPHLCLDQGEDQSRGYTPPYSSPAVETNQTTKNTTMVYGERPMVSPVQLNEPISTTTTIVSSYYNFPHNSTPKYQPIYTPYRPFTAQTHRMVGQTKPMSFVTEAANEGGENEEAWMCGRKSKKRYLTSCQRGGVEAQIWNPCHYAPQRTVQKEEQPWMHNSQQIRRSWNNDPHGCYVPPGTHVYRRGSLQTPYMHSDQNLSVVPSLTNQRRASRGQAQSDTALTGMMRENKRGVVETKQTRSAVHSIADTCMRSSTESGSEVGGDGTRAARVNTSYVAKLLPPAPCGIAEQLLHPNCPLFQTVRIVSHEHQSHRFGSEEFKGSVDQKRLKLRDMKIWAELYSFGTEMIATNTGRRVFPSLSVDVSGLCPTDEYIFVLDMILLQPHVFRHQGGQWTINTHSENDNLMEQTGQIYVQEDSPKSGAYWMESGVNFTKAKITNNKDHRSAGMIQVYSMRRYIPRYSIFRVSKNHQSREHGRNAFGEQPGSSHSRQSMSQEVESEIEFIGSYIIPGTQFYTVTAYQNPDVIRVKIDTNPFAKGFRNRQSSLDVESIMMASMRVHSMGSNHFSEGI